MTKLEDRSARQASNQYFSNSHRALRLRSRKKNYTLIDSARRKRWQSRAKHILFFLPGGEGGGWAVSYNNVCFARRESKTTSLMQAERVRVAAVAFHFIFFFLLS